MTVLTLPMKLGNIRDLIVRRVPLDMGSPEVIDDVVGAWIGPAVADAESSFGATVAIPSNEAFHDAMARMMRSGGGEEDFDIVVGPVAFTFKTDADAVFFKLRWGEDLMLTEVSA